jgi:hypothetical protein
MNATISVSPRIGVVLSEVTETPNLETAMWRILTEYVDLKTRELRERARTFEVRWGMTFAEFAERLKTNQLGQDAFSYEIESAYWEWEEAETLLKHYEGVRARWM